MKRVYKTNLYSLRHGNIVAAVLAAIFALFPILITGDYRNAIAYFVTALAALLLAMIASREIRRIYSQHRSLKKWFIYILTIFYYINIIMFGMFLGVWSNPFNFAVTIMIFLVCALSLFIFSPIFNLTLTLCAMAAFTTAAVLIKPPEIYITDICNIIFSGIISSFMCWRISMLRLVSALNEYKLEDERNKYFDESTIDELTKLRNRRDFKKTFQRYLSSYRSSDDWLCIAMSDIDFFKKYNDHYGHPKGDDCLRAIGKAFNRLKETMGVYCARVGGEEFAMLWFEKDASHVDAVVSRINKLIKILKIPHEKSSVSEYVTMSIGVYVERCGASHDADELYSLADKSLYSAKENGRNCAIICGRDIAQYQIKPV
jgi:diguanylate cyclase (GGDEF)-like protein